MENKKYKLTKETKVRFDGVVLHRIQRTDKTRELGGFIFSEKNLSQNGNAWVYGDAEVFGRFNVTTKISVELPRITIDTPEKVVKLKEFLDRF